MNDLKLCHKQNILVWLKINLTSTPALVYRSLRSQLAMFIIFLEFSSYGLFLENTPETRYSKRARKTPFVYYIESFTISRQNVSIKSHEGSWVLFTISRILLYRGLLYRVSGVYYYLFLLPKRAEFKRQDTSAATTV